MQNSTLEIIILSKLKTYFIIAEKIKFILNY